MYEKIVIIGSAGSGKSTLARKLGPLLKIKVTHLDRRFWEPNWKQKPRDTRIEILEGLVRKKRWIIEGSYLSSSDSRLQAADTIIFLDLPVYLCLWAAILRYWQYRKEPRPDLPQGCPERLSLRYILKVLAFPFRGRRLLLEKLEEIDQRGKETPELPKKTIHIFNSREEIDAFLCSLPAHPQKVRANEESRSVQKATLILPEGALV